MKWITSLLVMLCVGCTPSIHMPSLTNQTPNTLTKDTQVVVGSSVVGTLDRGSRVQTESEDKPQVEATLSQDTKALVGEKENLLPKNTKVVLPPDTFLILKDPASVRLEESTDITLKKGTVVAMSGVNWYAILFYLILAGGAAYWLFYIKNQDKDENQDGYVDVPKPQSKNQNHQR